MKRIATILLAHLLIGFSQALQAQTFQGESNPKGFKGDSIHIEILPSNSHIEIWQKGGDKRRITPAEINVFNDVILIRTDEAEYLITPCEILVLPAVVASASFLTLGCERSAGKIWIDEIGAMTHVWTRPNTISMFYLVEVAPGLFKKHYTE